MHESSDIIQYLFEQYGDGDVSKLAIACSAVQGLKRVLYFIK